MPDESEYLKALEGIHTWICAGGHCHWEGDYMLVEEGQLMECPVKMMFDLVKLHEYLGLNTLPNADEGRCPYFIDRFSYTEGVIP